MTEPEMIRYAREYVTEWEGFAPQYPGAAYYILLLAGALEKRLKAQETAINAIAEVVRNVNSKCKDCGGCGGFFNPEEGMWQVCHKCGRSQ